MGSPNPRSFSRGIVSNSADTLGAFTIMSPDMSTTSGTSVNYTASSLV